MSKKKLGIAGLLIGGLLAFCNEAHGQRWEYHRSVDAMTDAVRDIAGVTVWDSEAGSVTLAVGCVDGRGPSVTIYAEDMVWFGLESEVVMDVRWDDLPATRQTFHLVELGMAAFYIRNGRPFTDRIAHHGSLLVRIDLLGDISSTIRFPLSGSKAAISKLPCGGVR